MKVFNTTLFLSLLLSISTFAQLTGEVNYEEVGISFTIPPGWQGQEGDGVILLGSNTLPGIVVLTTHNYGIIELKTEARKGYSEGYGTRLSLSGELEDLSETAVGGVFTGTLEGQGAKAYLVGIANPYEGPGITIMAATLTNMYSQQHEDIAKKVFRSVTFKKVDKSSELAEWKTFLSGVRLTYMDSYSSSSYTDGGVGGGYSTEIKIDLCSEGYFNYNNDSDMTVSGSGVSGYSTSDDRGSGKWEIKVGANGQPALVLNFRNNEVYSYSLTYEDEKTFLNGNRYFRTTEGEYAPNCN
jgi:hypothetical protein